MFKNKLHIISSNVIILLIISSPLVAQWKWVSPTPTGNDLNQVYFINQNKGWILGNNGALLKTTDGGTSWRDVKFTSDYLFTRMISLDNVNFWLLGNDYPLNVSAGNAILFYSSDCGETWTQKFNTSTLPDSIRTVFFDVYFRDHLHGLSVGKNGLIFSTNDGAQTWQVCGNARNYSLEKMEFFNDSLGFISGGLENVLPYPSPIGPSLSMGIILRTTNQGAQWDTIYNDTIKISSVYFRNSQHVWALGYTIWKRVTSDYDIRYYLLSTPNGGEYWEIKRIGSISSLQFFDDSTGMGLDGNAIVKTTNGGMSWSYHYTDGGRLNSLLFTDLLHGFIVGESGEILQTTNAGATWAHYDSAHGLDYSLNDVNFINSDTGVIAGYYMHQTTNGGTSWSQSGISGYWISTHCIDKKNCWACGDGGKVIYSNDAGATWVQQSIGATSQLRCIKIFNSQIGWTGGDDHIIFKTTNGGTTWFSQSLPSYLGLEKIIIQDSNRVTLYGSNSSAYTSDGGTTWLPLTGLLPVFWLNTDTGWAKGGGTLYRTFDGGQTWELIGGGYVNMFFVDANNGWTYSTTKIQKTTDGGHTWKTDLNTEVWDLIQSAFFTDSAHGWCITYHKIIRYGYTSPIAINIDTVSTNSTQGWNLISLPVKPHTLLKDSLYSSSASFAYSYNGQYNQEDSLQPGKAYWLKFRSEESQAFTGEFIHFNSFDVPKGWNILGGISTPLPVTSISSMPAGVSVSSFYEYIPRHGYHIADTIMPGRGYWVNVTQDCRFTFADSTVFSPNGNLVIDKTMIEPPPPPEEFNNNISILPTEFALQQNYPNPFNPSTVIRYQIPNLGARQVVLVKIKIYNILGEEIATLVDEMQDAGFKSVTLNADNVPSGVYLYRMQAENFSAMKKLLVIK